MGIPGWYAPRNEQFIKIVKDINRFCSVNNCSIDVYGIANGEKDGNVNELDGERDIIGNVIYLHIPIYPYTLIYSLKVTQNKPTVRHVSLLLTENDGTYHYSTIKTFSHLLRSQVIRYEHRHFFCFSCLHGFTREELLASHVLYFKVENAQRTEMPLDDPTLKFTNIQNQLKAPFAAYAEFECILQRRQQVDGIDVDTHTHICQERVSE